VYPFGADSHDAGGQLVLLSRPHGNSQFRVAEKQEKNEHQNEGNQNGPEVNLADDEAIKIVGFDI